jgi:hypothetical protein
MLHKHKQMTKNVLVNFLREFKGNATISILVNGEFYPVADIIGNFDGNCVLAKLGEVECPVCNPSH